MSQVESRGSQGFESRQIVELEGGEKITIERITNPEDPRIDLIQNFLKEQFKSQEVDPVEVMKAAIAGKDPNTGGEVAPYIVILVQNQQNEVISVATGAVLETKNADYEPIGNKAIVQGSYIAVVEKYRRLGVGARAFERRMGEAMEDAKRRNLEIVAYVGEVVDDSEAFINSQGGNRMYFRESENSFSEIPYYQPPLDWNFQTGNPAEGAGTVPEHLMVKMFDGSKTTTGDQLLELVRPVYDYNNYRERDAFKTAEGRVNTRAYRTHTRIIENIEEELTEAVSDKELAMISRTDRENLASQGTIFEDHTINS